MIIRKDEHLFKNCYHRQIREENSLYLEDPSCPCA